MAHKRGSWSSMQHHNCYTLPGEHTCGGDSGHHEQSTCRSQDRGADENVMDGDTLQTVYSHDDDIRTASTAGARANLSEGSVAALFTRPLCAAQYSADGRAGRGSGGKGVANCCMEPRRHMVTSSGKRKRTRWQPANVTTAGSGMRIAGCVFVAPVRQTGKNTLRRPD